jgi:hypothetical protein
VTNAIRSGDRAGIVAAVMCRHRMMSAVAAILAGLVAILIA